MRKGPLLFLILIVACSVLGQRPLPARSENKTSYDTKPDIVFDNYTERDGLSNNNVSSLIQDNYGFLWIGTSNGLNRYDGKKFNVFKKNRRDPKSILSNLVIGLEMDKKGKIYGLTPDGIFTYDYATNAFNNTYLDMRMDKIYPTDFVVIDEDLTAIGTSSSGMILMDLKSKKYTRYKFDPNDVNSLHTDRISRIVKDPKKNGLWFTSYSGIGYFDLDQKKFSSYRNKSDSEVFINQNIEAICLTPEGNIWFLNNETKLLKCFNPENMKILYTLDLSKMMKIPYAGTLFETKDHELWYSSISYEIIRIKYRDGLSFQNIKNDPTNPTSIPGNYVGCYWEDSDHTLWQGTVAGISRVNTDRNFYRVIPIFQKYPELEENNWQITCIAQDPVDQTWWWASREGVIYQYNPFNGESKSIDIKEKTDYRNKSFFITDLEFIDQKIVICMSGGYPVEWDRASGKFKIIYNDKEGLGEYAPSSYVKETDSTWIIGNNSLPLLRWNKKTGKYQAIHYPEQDAKQYGLKSGNWMQGYVNQGVWIASEQALGYLAPGANYLKRYALEETLPDGKKMAITTGYYNSLDVDKEGNAWFSLIGNGLYKMDKKTGKCLAWDSSNGLISEVLNSSTPSFDGKIWCASFNKYSVFDAPSQRFYNFKLELSNNNSFYYNYTIPLANGHILSTIKGFLVEFFPEKINRRYPGNPPMISAIDVPSGQQLIWNQNELVLEPTDNFLTVHFASLSSPNIYDYYFQYKIDGINKDWIKADKDDKANYTNLSAGHYVFELQAISKDGKWQSPIKTLSFYIKAPFYKTWWFLLVMAIILGVTAYFIIRNRIENLRKINKLKTMAQLLEKEKTVVMYENLKQHLNPHFLFNSLTSLGSLIRINPKEAGEFLDTMSKVYRYILKNKDNETVPLGEELKFVELYIQLQKTRFGEGLNIDINISEEFKHRRIAPVTLQNLVENAIKHNIADVEEPLLIYLYTEDDYLVVKNRLNRKNYVETSNEQGLKSMVSLYRFLADRPMIIEDTGDTWSVKIPLI